MQASSRLQRPEPRWAVLGAFNWRFALLLLACLAMMTRSPPVVAAVTLALCLWALRGPYWALQSLALATAIKFLNPDLVSFPAGSGALFWLVILVAVLRLLPAVNSRTLPLVVPVLLFAGVALLTSLASSRAPVVSVLKILSFAAIVSATLAGAAELLDAQLNRLLAWLLTLTTVIVVCSLATLFRPEIAYEINTRLLHGIINQPQTLGVIAAPVVSALLSVYLLERKGLTPLHVLFTGLLCAGMLLTQARTAAIAALAGVAAAVLVSQFASRARGSEPRMSRLVIGVTLIATALCALEFNTGKVSSTVSAFVLKRADAERVTDAFLASRGSGAELEFQNFLNRPLTGNGFGVYANGEFPTGVVTLGGIPISAPVEKGFLPTAVLEETGLFGAAAFLYLVLTLGRQAWRSRSLPLVAAFTACLFVNLGEDNLTSPAGIGFLLWLMIALAVRSGRGVEMPEERSEAAAAAGTALSASYPNLMS